MEATELLDKKVKEFWELLQRLMIEKVEAQLKNSDTKDLEDKIQRTMLAFETLKKSREKLLTLEAESSSTKKATTTPRRKQEKINRTETGTVILNMLGEEAEDEQNGSSEDVEEAPAKNATLQRTKNIDAEVDKDMRKFINSLPMSPARRLTADEESSKPIVPQHMPKFRGKNGTDDPVEFLQQFMRVMTAYSIRSEHRFFELLPLCLDTSEL